MTTVIRNRPTGKLDLELGGKQKITANASTEEGKQESQLFNNNESEKTEEHSSSVQIGSFVFCGPLPAMLLEGGFCTELQVQIGHSSVFWQNPRLKFVFRMRSYP